MLTARAEAANRFRRVPLGSALPGVSDAAWDAFVRAMSARPIRSAAPSGGIGSFDLRQRRLGEIGVMANMRREAGRWVGDLLPQYARLGEDAAQQYQVFVLSTRLYDAVQAEGRIPRPAGVTRSGALAILHCGGTEALRAWPEGAFKTTMETFGRANNIF